MSGGRGTHEANERRAVEIASRLSCEDDDHSHLARIAQNPDAFKSARYQNVARALAETMPETPESFFAIIDALATAKFYDECEFLGDAGVSIGPASPAIFNEVFELCQRQPSAIAPFEPFPLDELPEPFDKFCLDQSRAIDCDPTFIILPTLSALASAIGSTRRVRVNPTWWEPSNIWTGHVGPPGTLKSPAFEAALFAINERQEENMDQFREQMEAFKIEGELFAQRLKDWKKGGCTGPRPIEPGKPIPERLRIDDVTVEAVGTRLAENPRGLILASDELSGFFGGLNRYNKNATDLPHWNKLFGGRTMIVDRKTGDDRLVYVPNACVSICGGIQPEALKRGIGEEHIETGLASRFLFTYPPDNSTGWGGDDPSEENIEAVRDVFKTLWKLSKEDVNGKARPRELSLTDGAMTMLEGFSKELNSERKNQRKALQYVWAKMRGYAVRLSLIIQLVRVPGAAEIDEASLEAAITMVRWFARESRRVYDMLWWEESEETLERRKLLAWIEGRGGSVTARDLQRGLARYKGSAECAEGGLNELVQSGYGEWKPVRPGLNGGAPTRVFVLGDAR